MNEKEYPKGIPECGSDALRFGLLAHCGQGRDVNLDVQRVAAYSKFCNKLWNATRFAFMYIGRDTAGGATFKPGSLPVSLALSPGGGATGPRVDLACLPDAWILSRLAECVDLMDKHLAEYQIAAATEVIYTFWYKELCDVYLEAIKPVMQLDGASVANAATKHATQTVLHACLHYGLRLLHPFMPFVTEELFQRLCLLTGEPRSSIMLASYPMPGAISALRSTQAEDAMECVFKVSGSIRTLRAAYLTGALEKHAPAIYIICRNARTAAIVASQHETICALAKSSKSPTIASLSLVPEGCSAPKGCATEILDKDTEVHIYLKGVVDFSKEVAKLEKELGVVSGRLEKLKTKMAAADYASKCPVATQVSQSAPSYFSPLLSPRAPSPPSLSLSLSLWSTRVASGEERAHLELPSEAPHKCRCVDHRRWHQSEDHLPSLPLRLLPSPSPFPPFFPVVRASHIPIPSFAVCVPIRATSYRRRRTRRRWARWRARSRCCNAPWSNSRPGRTEEKQPHRGTPRGALRRAR